MGSACLSLAYVSCGYMDVYQVDFLSPWDAAAGVVLVREAGGYMCDTDGIFNYFCNETQCMVKYLF